MNDKPETPTITDSHPSEDAWGDIASQAYDASSAQPKVQNVVCTGVFSSAPTDEAFRLNPPQIGIRGGFALFNQNCDDERIKKLPNFKPHSI